jgi:hypothetical protein
MKNREQKFSTNFFKTKKKDKTDPRIQIKMKQLEDWQDSLVEIELMSNYVDLLQDQLNAIYINYFSTTIGARLNREEHAKRKNLKPLELQSIEIELKEITQHIKVFNESFRIIKKSNTSLSQIKTPTKHKTP